MSAVVSTAVACFPSHSLSSICLLRRLAAGVAWIRSQLSSFSVTRVVLSLLGVHN